MNSLILFLAATSLCASAAPTSHPHGATCIDTILSPNPLCDCYSTCALPRKPHDETYRLPCCTDSDAFESRLTKFARSRHLQSAQVPVNPEPNTTVMPTVQASEPAVDGQKAKMYVSACLYDQVPNGKWVLAYDGCLDRPTDLIWVDKKGAFSLASN
ncbi:hypothetical protein BC828DRAFT_15430 [Blastocladiella britannica]|nr:hypothetical protein BC828DRAFT_15430 [Blastocladiella britannica]